MPDGVKPSNVDDQEPLRQQVPTLLSIGCQQRTTGPPGDTGITRRNGQVAQTTDSKAPAPHRVWHPDSAPAQLQDALAASAVAATEEATWAAHRRRDVSASWERPSLITQIQTFAAEHLDLDLSPVLDAMNQTDTFLESVV